MGVSNFVLKVKFVFCYCGHQKFCTWSLLIFFCTMQLVFTNISDERKMSFLFLVNNNIYWQGNCIIAYLLLFDSFAFLFNDSLLYVWLKAKTLFMYVKSTVVRLKRIMLDKSYYSISIKSFIHSKIKSDISFCSWNTWSIPNIVWYILVHHTLIITKQTV